MKKIIKTKIQPILSIDIFWPVTFLVSPVTLDDVTSGFNIGKNVSLEHDLNRMLGFTREDVIEIIDYYRANGIITHPTEFVLEIMTEWYGNYPWMKNLF